MKKIALLGVFVVMLMPTGTKADEIFNIFNINGYKETYKAGEEIVFYFESTSPQNIQAEPDAGFWVQATMRAVGSSDLVGVMGRYDNEKRAWKIMLKAPNNPYQKHYEIHLYLYCVEGDSPCAEGYGRSASAHKQLPLNLVAAGGQARSHSVPTSTVRQSMPKRDSLPPPSVEGDRRP